MAFLMTMPTFPVGLYCVLLGDIASIPAASFNMVVNPYWAYDGATTALHLTQAHAAGLLLIPGFTESEILDQDTAFITATVNANKADDTLAYWNTFEEPDTPGLTVEDATVAYSTVKGLDPNRSILMVDYALANVTAYAAAYDIFMSDQYPIGTVTIGTWRGRLDAIVAAATKPVWQAVQASGYPDDAGQPWVIPTTDELRCMTYNALIAGVQGIVYWCHAWSSTGSSGDIFYMPDNPVLWTFLQSLGAELCTLGPVLAQASTGTVVASSNDDVDGRLFAVGGYSYLIAANSANGALSGGHYPGVAQADVTFSLSSVLNGSAELIGAAGTGSALAGRVLPVRNGVLTDDFDAYAVHIYRISPFESAGIPAIRAEPVAQEPFPVWTERAARHRGPWKRLWS